MIRLTSLELRNFKNIREGNIVLSSWSTKRSLPGSDIIVLFVSEATHLPPCLPIGKDLWRPLAIALSES